MDTIENTNLQVECSPKTFRRLQTDENYRDEITRQVLESHSSDELDFIPNILVNEIPSGTGHTEEDVEEKKDIWLEAPTKLLLSLVEELQPNVGKTFSLKNKTKMWAIIQAKLAEQNYSFSVAQVQGKYRGLERKFKETKLHNSKTGRDRKTCPYESDLNKVLGEKRGLYPDFVLDSDNIEGTSREALMQNASQESIPSTSEDSGSPAFKRRKPSESAQDRILKRIDEIGKEKSEYHSKILEKL